MLAAINRAMAVLTLFIFMLDPSLTVCVVPLFITVRGKVSIRTIFSRKTKWDKTATRFRPIITHTLVWTVT
jgi:hypothetical protein